METADDSSSQHCPREGMKETHQFIHREGSRTTVLARCAHETHAGTAALAEGLSSAAVMLSCFQWQQAVLHSTAATIAMLCVTNGPPSALIHSAPLPSFSTELS